MSTQQRTDRSRDDVSGWAIGGMMFAATMMGLVGMYQLIIGLAAIFNDDFFVVTSNYAFDIDVTAWGWIHLIFGLLMLAVSFGLMSQSTWAGVATIVVASLSAIANFFFLPYYPLWAVIIIAINVWVIWSVTRPGALGGN